MPGFYLYVSNRLEILKDHLFRIVAEPLRSPLKSELIVVQSKGMERWLTQQLAEKAGIWANARFPFPNTMVRELFQLTIDSEVNDRRFSPDVLTWRILHLLDSCLSRSSFASLKDYLDNNPDNLKTLQLCERIADRFDQYTVYRPDMLLQWEAGRDEHWQAQLWRELAVDLSSPHRAVSRQSFFKKASAGLLEANRLPTRLSIFGISTLPPFHLEIFAALARHLSVHLFFMNPSSEYWETIASPKQIAKRRSTLGREEGSQSSDDHLEAGNPLLASWGKMGRDFFAMLIDQESCQEIACFKDPGEASLLACLQSDVLNLRDRGHDGVKTPLSPNAGSLQIHSCHSPLREVEVLYDCLLGLFERSPELAPNDILVMTPSIEIYAPFITAVFGGVLQDRKRIPFSIADRSVRSESPLIQAFFKILALKGSRLGADEVLDLLESAGVQRRFDFEPGDIAQIRQWVERSHIRWGIDGEDRKSRGLPGFQENSWKAGLERLLLGYALPEQEDQLFEDILPFGDMEGSATQVLGKFAELMRHLFSALEEMARPRTLAHWCEALRMLLSRFIKPDEESELEFRLILHHLQLLEEIQQLSGVDVTVDLEAVRYILEHRLEQDELKQRFLGGGVTFCKMLPMRSIPAKVVALLGMNGAAFPRASRPLAFDLMAQSPRKGDRSLPDEDRYLFLEALLSARERLHISYVGQSVRDNSLIPPSVLVSELLEVIDRGFLPSSGSSIESEILIRHPLQAFSPSYFLEKNRLFSFSEENFEALQSLRRQSAPPLPFVSRPIGEPSVEWKHIHINQLKRFFRNPSKFFCGERLGLTLTQSVTAIDNREPFDLDGLDDYELKQDLLGKVLEGKDLWSLYPAARKRGVLPPANSGEVIFHRVVSEVEALASRLKRFMAGSALPPIEVDLEIAGFRLFGGLKIFRPDHLIHYRCATVKPHDRLALWIDHLTLNCCSKKGYPTRSVLVGTDAQFSFPPIREAETLLKGLLDVFWVGLSQPLPFFSETSFEYASEFCKRKSRDDALVSARQKWNGRDFGDKRGESEDPYHSQVFGKVDALDESFISVALRIFEPILKCQEIP
jgi:exodeoxyribonuclease V gamma subunit